MVRQLKLLKHHACKSLLRKPFLSDPSSSYHEARPLGRRLDGFNEYSRPEADIIGGLASS